MLLNKIIGYAVIALLSLSFMTTDAQASSVRPVHIPIITNGKALQTDVPPVMVQNRILVPFRAIAQSTGAHVHWDATTKLVTVQKNKKTIILQVQSTIATINGQSVTLDVPPIVHQGRTFVPVRFVSETLDANVQWTGKEVRMSWNALQRSTFSVYVNQIKIGSHIMTDGVYTYIPLKQLLTAIDVNVDWIETNETMTVRLSRGQMMITAGKKEVIVDNHEMITPLAPIRVNDEWYVSASWVMSIFGAQMSTSGTNMFFTIPRTTFRSPMLLTEETAITVPQHIHTPTVADERRLLISDNPELLTTESVPNRQATLALDNVHERQQTVDHRVFGWHANMLGQQASVAIVIDNLSSSNDLVVTSGKGAYRTSPNSWGHYDVGLPIAEAMLRQSLTAVPTIKVKAGTSAVIQSFDVANNQLLGFLYDFTVQQEGAMTNYRIRTIVTSSSANFSTVSPTLAPLDSYATHPRGVWKGSTLEATLPAYTTDSPAVAYSISNGRTDHLLSVANALSDPSQTVHNPGHYGLTYRVSIPIQNESGEPKTIRLRFSGRGGAYCGGVKINGVVHLIPPLRPITQSAYIDYTVFSPQDVLELEFMHAGGAALPLGIEISTVR